MDAETLKKKIDGLFFGLHSTNPGDINALPEILNYLLENAGGAKDAPIEQDGISAELSNSEEKELMKCPVLKFSSKYYVRNDTLAFIHDTEIKEAISEKGITAVAIFAVWTADLSLGTPESFFFNGVGLCESSQGNIFLVSFEVDAI